MSFWLEADETISLGVRRLLNELVDQILQDLTDPEKNRDEGVHDARKNCKRVRAVYRLIRDEIGISIYRQENFRFRDTARLLAGARDSLVMIQTLDKLVNTHSDQLPIQAYKNFRQYLVDRYQKNLTNELDHLQNMSAIHKSMQEASFQISNMPLVHEDFFAFQGGLRRTYKRCRKAMNLALAQPSPEIFHEWRKRVKYLWHQVEILGSIQPEILTELSNDLHALSDYLGDDHDMAELRKMIFINPTYFDDEKGLFFLIQLVDQERLVLEENALNLGEKLFSFTPKKFVKHMEAYWRAWVFENSDERQG